MPNGYAESHFSRLSHQAILAKFRDDLAQKLNIEQMFALIDHSLPFEACLYYQVLPLFLEGGNLHLGMVSPDDDSAAEYVRRIVSYHNYNLLPHCISSDALQTSLTAYLNHSRTKNVASPENDTTQQRQQRAEPSYRSIQETLVVDSPEQLMEEGFASSDAMTSLPELTATAQTSTDHLAVLKEVQTALQNGSGEIVELEPESGLPLEEGTKEALQTMSEETPEGATAPPVKPEGGIVTSPQDEADLGTSPADPLARSTGEPEQSPSAPTAEQVQRLQQRLRRTPVPSMRMDAATLIDIPFERPEPTVPSPDPPQDQAVPVSKPIPRLEVPPKTTPTSAINDLGTLPPKKILQNLLSRIVRGGIGRLYFEAKADRGRVLWSQEGKLKSILDDLDLETFQALNRELKQLAGLSPDPVQVSRQVERERLYRQERILMLFRFIPSEHGENATLQILRGSAMQFYQQQRLTKLERDALGIARQLQGKLNEIRDRARAKSNVQGTKLEALPALNELLQNIEQQLDSLQERGPDEEIPE
jgi:hypothetical protein